MSEKPSVDFKQVLADNGMPVTEDELKAKFQTIVRDEGVVTNTSRMSPFWKLITAIVTTPVMMIIDLLASTVLANMFVATASGAMLRLLAWGVNLTAKSATAAAGEIRFYKADAKQAVTINSGTQIQTERINGVVYTLQVTTDTTIAAGATSGLVPVEATEAGAAWNLAPGYYRILPVAVSGISHAASEDDWLLTPGADEESDDELRDRVRNQFNVVGSYHIDAVYRSAIASVAGLSIDRIFFQHDAPRGPGTANAYLLLDSGEPSQPFIDAVNRFITDGGNHGHGDDMQCMAMPETVHDLAVTVYVTDTSNYEADELEALKANIDDVIRCAFRENTAYTGITKTWPYSRFSFSQLGKEVHTRFALAVSLAFSLPDIVSDLNIPRLGELTVVIENA